jgi:hypothetical protein
MSDDKKSTPFYERRLFQGTAAVVALVAAVLALEGRLGGIIGDLFPPPPPPVSWVEVVLDTSSAMQREFEGESQLEAAGGAIAKAVKELDNEGLGLRRTATSCEGKSEQLVGLDSDHSEEVVNEAQSQSPEGEASIVQAVVGGLEEFKREPIARRGAESRRLFIFTAGVNQCSNGDLGEELAEELEAVDINTSSKLELIALGASDTEIARLEEIKAALKKYANVHMTLHAPENQRELNHVATKARKRAREANEVQEELTKSGMYDQE